MELEERPRDCSPGHAGKEGLEASRGFSGAGEPVWDFSRGPKPNMSGKNFGKIVNSVDVVGKSKNGRKPSGMESHSEPGIV